MGGSGRGVAVSCVYYFYGERSAAALYGNCRAVLIKDIFGDETSSDLHIERFQ